MTNFQLFTTRARLWMLRLASSLPMPVAMLRGGSGQGEMHPPNIRGINWEAIDIDGRRGEWLTPLGAPDNAVLLYLHGGGFMIGVSSSSRWLAGHLALACHVRTLLLDYRLAPEHPYPASLDDCLAAYRWLLTQGYSPERIVIAGDSAGGQLAFSLLLRMRDLKLPLPAGAVGLSPATDPTCSGKSMKTNIMRDALLSPRFARLGWRLYVGNHALDDPYLSLLTADLRGLPPLLVQVGGDELLLDDARRFAQCAQAAGIDVTFEIYPHMWHGFHYSVPTVPEANRAIGQIANFVKGHSTH